MNFQNNSCKGQSSTDWRMGDFTPSNSVVFAELPFYKPATPKCEIQDRFGFSVGVIWLWFPGPPDRWSFHGLVSNKNGSTGLSGLSNILHLLLSFHSKKTFFSCLQLTQVSKFQCEWRLENQQPQPALLPCG